jgi:hypothetical protein
MSCHKPKKKRVSFPSFALTEEEEEVEASTYGAYPEAKEEQHTSSRRHRISRSS